MNKDYTFKVTSDELNVLFDSLVEMPFKKVADLYFKMRGQAQEQVNAQNEEGNN